MTRCHIPVQCLRLTLLVTVWLGSAAPVWADGTPLDRRVTLLDWNLDIVLGLNAALAVWLYVRGLAALAQIPAARRQVSPWRLAAFFAGIATLGVALVSPLDLLGEQVAWAHMVQHMLVMTVAAPLLVAAAPGRVWLWGLSPPTRRLLGRSWGHVRRLRPWWGWAFVPGVLFLLYAAVTWLWHVPRLYEAALHTPWVHDVQHLSFFLAGCLFWRLVLDPSHRVRVTPMLGMLLLFATTLHTTVLGVLMTIAPEPWYTTYVGRSTLWGLTTLEDQQLAGLIMWMPACVPYLLAALFLLAQCLDETPRTSAPRVGAPSWAGGPNA